MACLEMVGFAKSMPPRPQTWMSGRQRSVLVVQPEGFLVHSDAIADTRDGPAGVVDALSGGRATRQEEGILRGQGVVADEALDLSPDVDKATQFDLVAKNRTGLCIVLQKRREDSVSIPNYLRGGRVLVLCCRGCSFGG